LIGSSHAAVVIVVIVVIVAIVVIGIAVSPTATHTFPPQCRYWYFRCYTPFNTMPGWEKQRMMLNAKLRQGKENASAKEGALKDF
jgi:hypothetical protein